MLPITRIFFITFAVLLAFSSISYASRVTRVFYCAGETVEKGDTTYTILKQCGEPAYRETLSSEECDRVEKWHYDCIGRRNVEELIFKKGILVDRISGERARGIQTCKPNNLDN